MSTAQKVLVIAALAVTVALGTRIILKKRSAIPDARIQDSTGALQPDVQSGKPFTGSTSATSGHRVAMQSTQEVSDLEFSRQMVSLPPPVEGAWSGPFLDSRSCFHPDNKATAVEVLPTWIRKAVQDGKSDLAARYLWSLLKLADDETPEISTRAVLALYRLGDSNGFALTRMRRWIESGFDYHYSEGDLGWNESGDIRTMCLRELSHYQDKRLDDVIQATWLKNRSQEGETLDKIDYAYYLEKHGHELPADYWMSRLESWRGAGNTFEILAERKPPELQEKLLAFFETHKEKPASTIYGARNALAAPLLFQMTGNSEYRDYLIKHGQAQVSAGSLEGNSSEIFKGLAATGDKTAVELLAQALRHKNAVIGELAIDALGNARTVQATELLFDSAMQKAETGQSFPDRELRALLEQNTPLADAKYESLRRAMLNGLTAWKANSRDFDWLEFFRKHRTAVVARNAR